MDRCKELVEYIKGIYPKIDYSDLRAIADSGEIKVFSEKFNQVTKDLIGYNQLTCDMLAYIQKEILEFCSDQANRHCKLSKEYLEAFYVSRSDRPTESE